MIFVLITLSPNSKKSLILQKIIKWQRLPLLLIIALLPVWLSSILNTPMVAVNFTLLTWSLMLSFKWLPIMSCDMNWVLSIIKDTVNGYASSFVPSSVRFTARDGLLPWGNRRVPLEISSYVSGDIIKMILQSKLPQILGPSNMD